LLVAAALLPFQSPYLRSIYDRPIDNAYRLWATVDSGERDLRVMLIDRRDPSRFWEIFSLRDEYDYRYEVERADAVSVVFSRSNPDYGDDQGRLKLFFNSRSKQLVKRIDFETSQPVVFSSDADAARRLGVSAEKVEELRARQIFAIASEQAGNRPDLILTRPLPTSTYAEFARARPERVKQGYDSQSFIGEGIGAYYALGDRVWVGKSFYDREGSSGVGAIGYVDASGVYTFLTIPDVVDWSVSSLWVEEDSIWAGLVSDGESAARSGGLLEYSRKTQRATVHTVPDVIHSIARVDGATFLGTSHGVYVIRNGQRTRYRMEPDITGRSVLIEESLQ
jgi:hypothetical protein